MKMIHVLFYKNMQIPFSSNLLTAQKLSRECQGNMKARKCPYSNQCLKLALICGENSRSLEQNTFEIPFGVIV